MRIRSAVARALGRLEPPARLVDWSLLAVVSAEVVTGLVSFTVGTPAGWPLFWLHRALGLSIIALLGWKLARVRHRLTNRRLWRRSTALSVLTLIAALGALSTGIVWVFGLDVRVSYWTLLSVHVGFGLVLPPLVVAHASTRLRFPRRVDFEGRRTAVQYTALLVAGATVYRLQEAVNDLLTTPGADRRFTGSQPRSGAGNGSFPITSWVADDPDPVDLDEYRLSVAGLIAEPRAFAVGDLGGGTGGAGSDGESGGDARGAVAGDEVEALLDCTSGWYTEQEWRGVRVGDLLAAAGDVDSDPETGAEPRYVRFVSVTGYRWSLPIEEAREALLATHVGDERLSHGHGAPVRLVAPGRRGFQWVKWVDRVEVRPRRDPAQWLVTLVSGFD